MEVGTPDRSSFAAVVRDLLGRGHRLRFRATGCSMNPTIREGDLVVVEPAGRESLQRGAVLLYGLDRRLFAHRLVRTDRFGSLILRGDAASGCDNPIPAHEVLGKVASVERGGSGVSFAPNAFLQVARSLRRRVGSLLRYFILTLLVLAGRAEAAVNDIFIDNVASNSGVGMTLSWSHTVGAGANRILIVGLSIASGTQSATSVFWGPTPLFPIGNVVSPGNANRIEGWFLLNPPVATRVLTVNLSSAMARTVGGSISFRNVNQAMPVRSVGFNIGNSNNPTMMIASAPRDAVVSAVAVAGNTGMLSVGALQTEQWNAATGVAAADVHGAGSTEPGAGAVTMSWNTVAAGPWAIGAVSLIPAVAPTAARLTSLEATRFDGGGVILNWRTGFEEDNLGFHIYREIGGQRTRITPSLVAGSALFAGPGTALTAGRAYSWWDDSEKPVQYWLEEWDLNGKTTLHGPITPRFSRDDERGEGGVRRNAMLLSRMGRSDANGVNQTIAPVVSNLSAAAVSGRSRGVRLPDVRLETQFRLASQPAVKIVVRREGWYRVTQPELVAAGISTNSDPRLLQLFADGVQQPILVSGEADGKLDAADTVEFLGSGLDLPSTDSRVYWLVAGSEPGKRIEVLSATGGPPSGARSFRATAERKDRTLYSATIRNGEADNFFGPAVSGEPVEQILTLRNLDTASFQDGLLEVSLQGLTDNLEVSPDHRVRVRLNSVDIGDVLFDGQSIGVGSFPVRNEWLREGQNVVSLTATGLVPDTSLIDFIRITYDHLYRADDDRLVFTSSTPGELVVEGFHSSRIRVIDITSPDQPRELLGTSEAKNGSFRLRFQNTTPGTRRFLAFGEASISTPAAVKANQPSSWNSRDNSAAILMISHRNFLDSVAALKSFHESQGRSVALVDVEDLYDEFSFGAKTPAALKDFVARTWSTWPNRPGFLLLAGDASVDPRNYLGFGDLDFVPTKIVATRQLETASDDWFADLDGDTIPELAAGRLPFRTVSEATTVISKLVTYQQSGDPGGWADTALIVADQNEEEFDYEAASTEVAALLPQGISVNTLFRGQSADARAELLAKLNAGQLLVNYIGHGSTDVWGRSPFLTSPEASTLNNGSRLPLVISMTCLTGLFHDVFTTSLAEALLRAPSGGAVAVWASSALTQPDSQRLLNNAMIQQLFQGGSSTIGEATVEAKKKVSDRDVRVSWILFGDPALRLK